MIQSFEKIYSGTSLQVAPTYVSVAMYMIAPFNGSIKKVYLRAGNNLPGPGNAAFNLSKNGVNLFNSSDRPVIAVGTSSIEKTTNFAVVKGDILILSIISNPKTPYLNPLTLVLDIDDGVSGVGGSTNDDSILLVASDPTSPPTVATGFTQAQMNSTNGLLWIWNGTEWRKVTTVVDPPVASNFDFSTIQGTNLTLWTAARLLTGAADGDYLATFPNNGVLGGNWTQSNAALQPRYVTNGINGLPILRSKGSSDPDAYGKYGTASILNKTIYEVTSPNYNKFTFFLCFKTTGREAGHDLQNVLADTGQIFTIGDEKVSGVWKSRARIYPPFEDIYTDTIDDAYRLLEVRLSDSLVYSIRINNSAPVTLPRGSGFGNFGGDMRLFGGTDGGGTGMGLIGDFGELCAWNIDLSSTDTATVRNAFATLYGVTV